MFLKVFIIILGSALPGFAGGVFAYKKQKFHSDNDAILISYDSVEPSGFVTWVISGGKRIRFEKTQFHTWLELDTPLPAEIKTHDDWKMVESRINEIKVFRKRFVKSQEVSQKAFDLWNDAWSKNESGYVRHENQWVTTEKFQKILKDKQSSLDAAQMALEKAKADRLEMERLKVEAEKLKIETEREKMKARIVAIREQIDQIESNNLKLKKEIKEDFLEMKEIIQN